ncbi:3-deoxy-manno-octulosonate cytidylyltransferase [Microbulbifer aggregans]|uniref:3-deoxy-manno-octulosonate cytidylyltransferase n=1 Tax=Microbulbifer aggregans TaxID=1769779 RepID=UPI001CFEFDE0|nr:3-deoxy-manno-octulosonate cytidylyltransferase [Microbulbifer aggregans]
MKKTPIRVVIPARYSSTRLPGKPLLDIAGIPMVVRVFQQVRAASFADSIVVATDDERIMRVLEAHSIHGVLTDPRHESGTDRASEVGATLGWSGDDCIINVQGDEPLIPIDLLAGFADFCLKLKGLEMATVSAPISNSKELVDPNVVKIVSNVRGDALYFSRSPVPYVRDFSSTQDWPLEHFRRHVGIYAYKYEVLASLSKIPVDTVESLEKLEQMRALREGVRVSVFDWHSCPPHGVDTYSDAESVVKWFLEQK